MKKSKLSSGNCGCNYSIKYTGCPKLNWARNSTINFYKNLKSKEAHHCLFEAQ